MNHLNLNGNNNGETAIENCWSIVQKVGVVLNSRYD